MKLSEIKKILETVDSINFQLPDGKFVPEYFHVTEVGLVTKNFIDCAGKIRKETIVNFQLWDANDYEHRLKAKKLTHIIALSEKVLGIEDFEIEVEYQNTTIGKYNLDFDGKNFQLLNKQTACLAPEMCCTPNQNLSEISLKNNSCAPNSGCC